MIIRTISIIGAGNMGSAVARGLSGKPGYRVRVSNPSPAKLEALARECPDIETQTGNEGMALGADLIILAVKPYVLPQVCAEIRGRVSPGCAVASLAAPVSLAELSEMLDGDTSVLKIIPNTAISVGHGMTFISTLGADTTLAEEVFSAVGEVAVIPERLMPAATALCSCGIAYGMRYIRAAVEGAVELGIPAADALRYELATLQGACALLAKPGAHPEAEIDKVTTPGGITIRGLNAMEAHGFTTAVVEGLKAGR